MGFLSDITEYNQTQPNIFKCSENHFRSRNDHFRAQNGCFMAISLNTKEQTKLNISAESVTEAEILVPLKGKQKGFSYFQFRLNRNETLLQISA